VVTQPRHLRLLALPATLALLLAALVAQPERASADTAPAASTAATVSSDALPTVQTDGVVWTQLIVGNTVYVGGDFTTATPAGQTTGGVVRTDILAYDLTSGALIDSFAPTMNGQVRGLAASTDGKTIYAVGSFTQVGRYNRYRIVALNAATGAVVPGFGPKADAAATAVAVSGSTVYIGGAFTSINSSQRSRAAAVDATTGALLPWAPVAANNYVRAIVVAPDASKVVLAGNFTSLNGSTRPGSGLGAVDPVTGASVQWDVAKTLYDSGTKSSFMSLASDGTNVYGVGYVFGSTADGNLEGTFSARWSDGAITWIEDCHGDTYSVAPYGDAIYTASHAHYCSNVPGGFPQENTNSTNATKQRALAFSKSATGTLAPNTYGSSSTYANFGGQPAPSLLAWYPDLAAGTYTGQGQAAWSVAAGNGYVLYGGEFPTVNGQTQSGLVRFATSAAAPDKDGPRISGANWVPSAVSTAPGTVKLTWQTNWDRDNAQLTYTVYKVSAAGNATAVYTTSAASHGWWDRPQLSFTDTGLTAGTTQTYKVRASDPFGNTVTSATVTSSASGSGAYANAVLADGASDYWRLGETAGDRAYDWTGKDDLVVGAGVAPSTAGAISDGTGSSTFSGAATAFGVTTNQIAAPNTFSIEAWFRTTTTKGGKIVGFGNAQSGNSSTYDRAVYMDATGKVNFGVSNGGKQVLTSRTALNDGRWHQVVASLGAGGTRLSIDGALVASKATVTSGQAYAGWWRVGGDSSWSGAADFTGDIDDVSIATSALTDTQVATHYGLGTGTITANQAPTAAFTASTDLLAASFNGSGSADADGSVRSYAWAFGDGTSGTGASTTHTYAASGTYTATLVVTDDKGASSSTSKQVVVKAANVAPTAAFTTSASGLAVDFDGSGSKDSDGTVASYAWSFGDGASGTGARTTHAYTAPGSYTAQLTVTDDSGATGVQTSTVTVQATNRPPTAAFSSNPSGLTAAFDASASADADGSIASYAWDFGDGTTGSGATTSHAYGADGSYHVVLTVTDDRGATATASKDVAVARTLLAQDSFTRTVSGGLGSADLGGAWSTPSNASKFAVASGSASVTTGAGVQLAGYLNGLSARDVDAVTTITVPTMPAGGGAYAGLVLRRTATSDYSARIGVSSAGALTIDLLRGATALKSVKVAGVTAVAGSSISLRVQATGASPTTISARAWVAGTPEPTVWQAQVTDSTDGFQAAGAVGLRTYVGSGVTNGPLVLRFDDLAVSAL
jgi:PKD repeat protein